METIEKIISDFVARTGEKPATVASKLGIERQQLRAYMKGDYKPKQEFYDRVFSVYGENLTQSVKKPTHSLYDEPESNKDMYRKFFEEHTTGEYVIVPRTIIDNYEMVPKAEQEQRRRVVDEALSSNKDMIAMLKAQVSELKESKESSRGLKTHKT